MKKPDQVPSGPLPATSKDSLEARIQEFQEDEYDLYNKASRRNYWFAEIATWTAIIAGVAVTALNALRETELIQAPLWGVIGIVLPIVGSLAAVLQSRFLDRKTLFESGRQKMMTALRRAKQRFAHACEEGKQVGKPDPFAVIEEETISEIASLEAARLAGYIATARGKTDGAPH